MDFLFSDFKTCIKFVFILTGLNNVSMADRGQKKSSFMYLPISWHNKFLRSFFFLLKTTFLDLQLSPLRWRYVLRFIPNILEMFGLNFVDLFDSKLILIFAHRSTSQVIQIRYIPGIKKGIVCPIRVKRWQPKLR